MSDPKQVYPWEWSMLQQLCDKFFPAEIKTNEDVQKVLKQVERLENSQDVVVRVIPS